MRICGIGVDPRPDIEPQPVQAVLFDFSNTLFHVVDTAAWVRMAAARAGVRFDEPTVTRLVAELDAAWTRPEVVQAQHGRDLSGERHRAAVLAWVGAVPDLAPLAEELNAALRSPRAWVPYDDTAPVLRELRRRGLSVGVVSNIAWDIRPYFPHHGLDGLVDAFVLSHEHGVAKPDPKLFLHACDLLGTDPVHTLMVGDSPEADGGAATLGMRAYVLPAAGALARRRGLSAVLHLLAEHPDAYRP